MNPASDDFDILDSIFADLDEAALRNLEGQATGKVFEAASKPSRTPSSRTQGKLSSFVARHSRSPSRIDNRAGPYPVYRTPLSPVTGNQGPTKLANRPKPFAKTCVPVVGAKISSTPTSLPSLSRSHITSPSIPSSGNGKHSSLPNEKFKRSRATTTQIQKLADPSSPVQQYHQTPASKADTIWEDKRNVPGYVPLSQRFTRCSVNNVSEKILRDFRREKIVIVDVESTMEARRLVLLDEWATTELEVGDIVNVIGDFVEQKPPDVGTSLIDHDTLLPTCTMSYSSDNLLIVLPDTLISATRVSDTVQCRRKAVVQEKMKSSGSDSTPALVYGNLLHEIFQSCMLTMTKFSDPDVALPDSLSEAEIIERAFGFNKRVEQINKLLKMSKNVDALFMLGIETDTARQYMKEKSAGFTEFAERFLGTVPKPDAFLTDPRQRDTDPLVAFRLAIPGVLDIEEEIWSPRLGLKGKVDASVQTVVTRPQNAVFSARQGGTATLPFEIKTGRSTGVLTHRAQTMLYTQMMSDRYDQPIESGLLYYTQSSDVIHVQATRNELRGLIVSRNDIARYLTHGKASYVNDSADDIAGLPPSQPPRLVSSPVKPAPAASPYRGAAVASSEPDDALWDDLDLVDIEDLPTALSEKRLLPPAIDDVKQCKRCYAADGCMLYRRSAEKVKSLKHDDMQEIYDDRTAHLTTAHTEFFEKWERLISLEESESMRTKKEIWTMSALERQRHGKCFASMVIDKSSSLGCESTNYSGDQTYRYRYRMTRSVLPYESSDHNATPSHSSASPSAQALTSGHISVGDPVVVSAEPATLGLARGFVLELTSDSALLGLDHSLVHFPGRKTAKETVFRVDKDELQAGMGRLRDNLAQLFYANGDQKRRRLVVDLDRPVFAESPLAPLLDKNNELNEDQIAAVRKVLNAEDYALILGMPGTGKTTTIVEIIKTLAVAGKSVLLTSYTHSAVDNILLKLKDSDIKILRLGHATKVMPEIAHLTLDALEAATSVAQLEQRYFTPQVVAATALAIDHPLFSRRKFDYCIVDEASQITLPTCLGPLRFADKFVLVGDHNQLPPLVRSRRARQDGLEVSLFRRLSEAHPSAVAYLTRQYRMNEDIMTVSNHLIYHNRLVCGNELVANCALRIPRVDGSGCKCQTCIERGVCWLKKIMEPICRVVFVDTDAVPGPENRAGHLVSNVVEADLVQQTAKALVAGGVRESQIGVITLYRQQIKQISERLDQYPGIEILTADRSQGRDKECILVSLVRSNAEANTGDLLRDWRRINVCFTRAKSKLVIFGSRSTLASLPLLDKFFTLVDSRGWLLILPPRAHRLHNVRSDYEAAVEQTPTQRAIRPTLSQHTVKTGSPSLAKRTSTFGDCDSVFKHERSISTGSEDAACKSPLKKRALLAY